MTTRLKARTFRSPRTSTSPRQNLAAQLQNQAATRARLVPLTQLPPPPLHITASGDNYLSTTGPQPPSDGHKGSTLGSSRAAA